MCDLVGGVLDSDVEDREKSLNGTLVTLGELRDALPDARS